MLLLSPVRLFAASVRVPSVIAVPSFPFVLAPPTAVDALSLHDALPISKAVLVSPLPSTSVAVAVKVKFTSFVVVTVRLDSAQVLTSIEDRKSTRLNSSHRCTSYAVFSTKKQLTTSD